MFLLLVNGNLLFLKYILFSSTLLKILIISKISGKFWIFVMYKIVSSSSKDNLLLFLFVVLCFHLFYYCPNQCINYCFISYFKRVTLCFSSFGMMLALSLCVEVYSLQSSFLQDLYQEKMLHFINAKHQVGLSITFINMI